MERSIVRPAPVNLGFNLEQKILNLQTQLDEINSLLEKDWYFVGIVKDDLVLLNRR